MHLKELTINGFKSFARKGELEFSTPITAIVGPNGSGKSNVAEAFRFVLGEQSVKSMRGKKGEDLIFNGSNAVSRSNRASVSIRLDNAQKNGTRVFPIDFDEIVIERVVHRDGTNEYSINGSKTRLKDIQEILAAANIGPTGHHIISQGEADRILSASGKERREMIEDALGLKVYQFKKNESERKLKKTLENITQVESLRKEVTPHLKFLERQIKKMERSRALQEELRTFYIDYLKREDVYLAFHTDRLTAERKSPLARQEELKEALENAKAKLQKEEDDETQRELVALEKDMSDVREKRQEIARNIGSIEGQIALIERQIRDAHARAEKESDEPIPRHALKGVIEDAEEERARLEKSDDISAYRDFMSSLFSSLGELLKNSFGEQNEGQLQSLEREHKNLVHEKEKTASELKDVEEEETKLGERYTQMQSDIESKNREGREAEREVFTIMNEQREVDHTLERINRELMVLERDRQDFKVELQEAVSLVGGSVGKYFEHQLAQEDVVSEDRAVQQKRKKELERMKIRLEELGAGSNDDILKEYNEVKERDDFLVHEIEDLTASVEKLEALIKELTDDLNAQFVEGIEKISKEFNHFFTLMFGGGTANLLRVKPKVKKKAGEDEAEFDMEWEDKVNAGGREGALGQQEEAEEGIDIDVKLPNKKVRGLNMLSGGERALTSIALIFAMSQVNPPLFVILDETDAALDEANSRRYGDMISALAEKSQLILITHNRETMGRAGVLYGVTMAGDGISKLLSVKFDEAVAVAK